MCIRDSPTREEIGGYYPSTYYPEAAPRQAGDLRRTAKRWSGKIRRWIAQDFYGYPAPESARRWQWARRLLLWPCLLYTSHLGTILKTLFSRGGYRDGVHGLVVAMFAGLHTFVKYAKAWERVNVRRDA